MYYQVLHVLFCYYTESRSPYVHPILHQQPTSPLYSPPLISTHVQRNHVQLYSPDIPVTMGPGPRLRRDLPRLDVLPQRRLLSRGNIAAGRSGEWIRPSRRRIVPSSTSSHGHNCGEKNGSSNKNDMWDSLTAS